MEPTNNGNFFKSNGDLRIRYRISDFVNEAKNMLEMFGTDKIYWTFYKRAEGVKHDAICPVWTPYPYGLTGTEIKSKIPIKGVRIFSNGKELINPKVAHACSKEHLNIKIVDDWTLVVSLYKTVTLDKATCECTEDVVGIFMDELKCAKDSLGSYALYWSFYNTRRVHGRCGRCAGKNSYWNRKPYESCILSNIDSTLFRRIIFHQKSGRYHINPQIKHACEKEGLKIELYDFWTVRIVKEWRDEKTIVESSSRKNDSKCRPLEIRFLWEAYFCMSVFKRRKVLLECKRRRLRSGKFFYYLAWTSEGELRSCRSVISADDLEKIVGTDNSVNPEIQQVCREVGMTISVNFDNRIAVELQGKQ